ncbi:hypothetical protein VPH35_088179 [Triticum aestivum]
MPSTSSRSREEFADSLEHPDLVPLVVLPRRDASPVTPADSMVAPGAGDMKGLISQGGRMATLASHGCLLRRGMRSPQTGSTPKRWVGHRDYASSGVHRKTERHVHPG